MIRGPSQAISVEAAISTLNRLLEADREAISLLVANRVPCNQALSLDPTCQVGSVRGEGWEVGLLGIINAIFGVDEDGWGYIAADTDDEGMILRFLPTPPRRAK